MIDSRKIQHQGKYRFAILLSNSKSLPWTRETKKKQNIHTSDIKSNVTAMKALLKDKASADICFVFAARKNATHLNVELWAHQEVLLAYDGFMARNQFKKSSKTEAESNLCLLFQ